MMRIPLLNLSLTFLIGAGVILNLCAQAPSYIRYTTVDGLPTNYVYGVVEDSNGIIWAYTENGLAKFDGYTFQHFSTEDGLPSNDIPWALKASDGKVWLYAYQNRPAYVWNDSIYIAHDEQGNLVGLTDSGKPLYSFPGRHTFIYDDGWKPAYSYEINADALERFGQKWHVSHRFAAIPPEKVPFKKKNEIIHYSGDSVFIWNTEAAPLYKRSFGETEYYYQNDSLHWYNGEIWEQVAISKRLFKSWSLSKCPSVKVLEGSSKTHDYALFNIEKGKIKVFTPADYDLFPQHYSRVRIQDSSFWIISDMGSIELDQDGRLLRRLSWTDKEIRWSLLSTYTDREGNIWQGTRNGGLLMIPFSYQDVRQLQLPIGANPSIERLLKIDKNRIIAVASGGEVYEIQSDSTKVFYQPEKISRYRSADLIYGDLLLSLDFAILHLDLNSSTPIVQPLTEKFNCFSTNFKPFHGVVHWNMIEAKKEVYTVTAPHGYIHHWTPLPSDRSSPCTITKIPGIIRLLYAHPDNHKIYGGDLVGLFLFENNKLSPFLHDKKELRDISALYGTPGKLWIGTESNGLFCYYLKEKVLEKVASVNNIHAIRPDGDWGVLVATNEGILIVPDHAPSNYRKLGKELGLPTSKIEDVLSLGDSLILVASNFGLHQINRNPISLPPLKEEALKLHTIKANGEVILPNALKRLSNEVSQLSFGFQLLSYASQGNIRYQTRLEPLESKWTESTEQIRPYFGLRPGQYTFNLRAIDAYGRQLTHPPKRIIIQTTIWQRLWFQVLLICIVIAYGLFRLGKTRRELEKEKALNRRLAEMEMQALKAQMNPHFIFNALGSIQYFIQTKEVELADDYLTRFARLMRLYLDGSRETLLPLEQEIALLENYTELEQMRFEQQFQVEIKVMDDISVSSCIIPSMMIQPFVENAIMHGLSERKDGKGLLTIHFEQPSPHIISCTISDNGIGRMQSFQHSKAGYRSHGMQIIQDKIDTLGAADLVSIDYKITDADINDPTFPGTIVNIIFKQLENANY